MSLNFPKHPKDMNREELFDMMQQVQSVARKNNKHSPMPTRTTLREGQTPTPADLHEEAARKELAGYYEEQVAMAGLPDAAKQVKQADTIHDAANEFAKGVGAMRQISKGKLKERDELDKQKGRDGMLESDSKKKISNDPERVKKFKEGKAEYNAWRNKKK